MPRKSDRQREIDRRPTTTVVGGENVGPPTTPTTGPAVPTQPGPTGLTVASNVLMFSAVTPLALIGLTWDAPPGIAVASYLVEAATDSGFTTGLVRRTVYQASASLELPTGTLYYFRVSAITAFVQSAPSATVSATTATDTSPPAVPASLSAVFNSAGDLEVSWVNPTSANFRDVEVSIYADSGFSTLLFRAYTSQQRLIWTAAQNRLAGSGAPDPTLYVRMASRSWTGVLSATAVPAVQPVKTRPADVTSLTQSWASDAGTASADLLITWATAAEASYYRLTIDGVSRDVFGTRYVYTFDQNAAEHSGTPDPVLSLSIVGRDGLDQSSVTATTATATNAAPAAPASVTLTTFFSAMAIAVTATQPVDIRTLRYRLIQTSPSAPDVTWDSLSTLQTRELSVNATYQVGVRMVDVFGQAGSETLSSTTAIDALTLADLRSEAIYTDSAGSSAATLAVMKDGTLGSGGVAYASNAGWVRWVQMRRELAERYRTVTLSMAPASGTSNWYMRTSLDGATWSYFAGSVTSGRIITAVADAAAAQAAAISSATLGNSTTSRVDFPTVVEARYIELWVRNTGANTTVREFYPRRLVQSDDIEAESIRAINIAASSITADRLTVSELSAIAADVGTVTFGGGIGVLSPDGITVEMLTSGDAAALNAYQLISAGAARAFLGGVYTGSANFMALRALPFASHNSEISIDAESPGTGTRALIGLRVAHGANEASLLFKQTGAVPTLEIDGFGNTVELTLEGNATINGDIDLSGGLNVGASTGAAAGEILADGAITIARTTAITNTTTNAALLRHSTSGTPAGGFGVDILWQLESTTAVRSAAIDRAIWTTATDASRTARRQFYVYDTAARECMRLEASGSAPMVGFMGAAAVARPTVTGSRGGNAALASVLTALANLGLITDSSS